MANQHIKFISINEPTVVCCILLPVSPLLRRACILWAHIIFHPGTHAGKEAADIRLYRPCVYKKGMIPTTQEYIEKRRI
jgi:hypothetical protein